MNMRAVTKEEQTFIKLILLSIQALRREDQEENGEVQVSIMTHHIPSLILDADSLEKAEELGLEKAQELWPKEEGWSHHVVAQEFEIPVTITAAASYTR
jgi:hypothetical protein